MVSKSANSEVVWVAVGQLAAFFGGFAGIKLLTSNMGPEAYGQLALGLSIAGMVNMFAYGPLGSAVTRFFSLYQSKALLGTYFATLRCIHGTLAALILPTGLFILALGLLRLPDTPWLTLVGTSLVFAVVTGLSFTLTSVQNAMLARRLAAMNQALDACMRPLLALGCMMFLGYTGMNALWGYSLAVVIVIASQITTIFRGAELYKSALDSTTRSETQRCLRSFLEYGGPLVIWAAISTISNFGDRWLVQGFLGLHEVGVYAALLQIANAPVTLCANIANQFAMPIAFNQAGDLSSNAGIKQSMILISNVSLIFLGLMVPVVVLYYFVGNKIVELLASHVFASGSGVLWLLTVGSAIFQYGQLLATKGLVFKKTHIYLIPKFAQGLSFLLLGLLLTRTLGLYGLAVSLLVAASIHAILIVVQNRSLTSNANS